MMPLIDMPNQSSAVKARGGRSIGIAQGKDSNESLFVHQGTHRLLGIDEEHQDIEQKDGRIIEAKELSKFQSLKEYDLETEYRPFSIQMEGATFLHLTDPDADPLRLGFADEAGTIEVIGWDLEVPAGEFANLPRHLARKFFELYSAAMSNQLTERDEAALETVSRQVDYRRYAATRVLPKYREATLIRKEPLFLQFYDSSNIKLDPSLEPVLRLLQPGDRFGAWFTSTSDGKITAIENSRLIPSVESLFESADMLVNTSKVEFDPSLKDLLPQAPKE